MRGLAIVLAALVCAVACQPQFGHEKPNHPGPHGPGGPNGPGGSGGSGGPNGPGGSGGSGGPHPPMQSGSGRPDPPMYSGSGRPDPPMFSGSGRPDPPMYSGSGRPDPPMQSGSGDHHEGGKPRPTCRALVGCFKKFAMIDNKDGCHARADKIFECFSSQKPSDICGKGCKHMSMLATKSVGRALAHYHCPARKDCPKVADLLPSEEDMKKFFADKSLCENQKALNYIREMRKKIESFKGDLIECGPTDMIHVEIFDLLEVIAEARCDGCDFTPAGKGFSQIKPDHFCPMQKKISHQIDTIVGALSNDARCNKLTQNRHKLDALLDKTIGVWCRAEKEHHGLCGHSNMGPRSDRKRRSFAKNIFTRLFPLA